MKVLIMDDEEDLRETTAELLEILGYEVKKARDGGEALALFEAEKATGNPFDVLILDLRVPGGMGGKEVLQELKRLDQLVIAIVSSRYSDDQINAHFEDYGFQASLPKPYTLSQLKTTVQQVSSNPATE